MAARPSVSCPESLHSRIAPNAASGYDAAEGLYDVGPDGGGGMMSGTPSYRPSLSAF
ncbi:protein of unknown function [Azospirillum lipoferum 4B]|uniref:Uncharacterized protein n=1 Tax=Azospirillum lipoferum (strain 4B) TaxID=862719 RepID=G7Z1S8_AZOL4|nr:protein of unknown function [Azospirillum lipoferum 4B]